MDQPKAESATVEQRLASMFGGEAEAPVEEQASPDPEESAPEEAADAAEDTADEVQEESSDEPFTEVTDDDGQPYKVPAKLKESFLRQKDYTQKTQALSALTKSAEDRIQFAEAKEQIFGTVLADVVSLRESQTKLQQLNGLDWAALYNADPGQALNLRHQMDSLKAEVDQKQQAIAQKASQYESTRKQHTATQWKLAVDGVKAKVGAVTPAEDAAMLKTVQDLGFSQEELGSRFADPRFLEAVYLASKYKALQSGKPGALGKANKAPPVLKPGAVNTMSAEVKQNLAFRKAVKAAPTSQSKAKVIEQRLASMFK
jgi:hypothetical protein